MQNGEIVSFLERTALTWERSMKGCDTNKIVKRIVHMTLIELP